MSNKKKRRNTNHMWVNVRGIHDCQYCDRTIDYGERALTINPRDRRIKRYWVCEDCIKAIRNVVSTYNEKQCLPFGDEGAAYALDEGIDQALEVLYDRGMSDEIIERVEERIGRSFKLDSDW